MGTADTKLPRNITDAAFEASGAAILVLTDDDERLSHNERFRTAFGLPTVSGEPMTLVDVVRSLSESGLTAIASVLSDEREGGFGEVVVSDGRAFEWRRLAILGARAWVFHDVTVRRQLVLALHDAGSWLRMIEMHMTNAVVVELDEDARLVGIWANSGGIFGKTDAMLAGGGLIEAMGESPGRECDERVRCVLATGTPDSFEYSLESEGGRRVFSANIAAMASSEGERAHATMMIRDVTDVARMQLRMLESEKLASVGLLAAGVAHEINNPLAYTLLNLEQIQSRLLGLARSAPSFEERDDNGAAAPEPLAVALQPILDAVRMCLEGCQRVQTIVHDLRRFSRSDPDERRVPVDVHRVLDFAIDMAGPQARRHAKIVRDFGDVPLVLADEGRLCQVFLNLILNAAQAITEGAPADHEIRLATSTDEHGRAIIEVSDSGEGMTQAIKERIFEPFFTTKAPGVGTGLGLAISQGITTAMGGEISVESTPGAGSVFRVVLPGVGS